MLYPISQKCVIGKYFKFFDLLHWKRCHKSFLSHWFEIGLLLKKGLVLNCDASMWLKYKKSKNQCVFSNILWLIWDCYIFWGFNDNVTENPKLRTRISSSEQSQIYRHSLSILKFVSHRRRVAIWKISFRSLEYCLEWDLIWIEFEHPSICIHVMEHKKMWRN